VATVTVRRIPLAALFQQTVVSSGRPTKPVVLIAPRRTVSRGWVYYFSFLEENRPRSGQRTVKLVRKPEHEPGSVYIRVTRARVEAQFKRPQLVIMPPARPRAPGQIIEQVKKYGIVFVGKSKPILFTRLYRRPKDLPDRGSIVWRQGGGEVQSLCHPTAKFNCDDGAVDTTWDTSNAFIDIEISTPCGNSIVGVRHNGVVQHNGTVTHGG
jgi:hypothetical protein